MRICGDAQSDIRSPWFDLFAQPKPTHPAAQPDKENQAADPAEPAEREWPTEMLFDTYNA